MRRMMSFDHKKAYLNKSAGCCEIAICRAESLWYISRAYLCFIFAYNYIFIKKRDIIMLACKYLLNKVLHSGRFSGGGSSYFYYTT